MTLAALKALLVAWWPRIRDFAMAHRKTLAILAAVVLVFLAGHSCGRGSVARTSKQVALRESMREQEEAMARQVQELEDLRTQLRRKESRNIRTDRVAKLLPNGQVVYDERTVDQTQVDQESSEVRLRETEEQAFSLRRQLDQARERIEHLEEQSTKSPGLLYGFGAGYFLASPMLGPAFGARWGRATIAGQVLMGIPQEGAWPLGASCTVLF